MLPAGKLKSNLEFNKSLGNIIDILKIAASIKLRQFQAAEPLNKNFFRELKNCVDMLDGEKISHPFFARREKLPRCILGITSDEGFIGGLNTLVINNLLDQRKDENNDVIIVLGERGAGYLEDINIAFISFPGITDELRPQEVKNIEEYLIKEYLKGSFGQLIIVYPKFISITSQQMDVMELLPCSMDFFNRDFFESEKIPPSKENVSRPAEVSNALPGGKLSNIFPAYERPLVEPNASQVISGLVKLLIGAVLTEIFWSSKLSELSARLMHLDSSEQELSKVNQKIRLEYFRYLHSLADKTIREVIAARFTGVH